MKKLYILLFTILISGLSFGQTTVLQESFETDGNGSRYTTSVSEFTDVTGGDFFTRTDGTTATVPTYYQVSGQDASYYFAAMDTDGDGNPTTLTMNFDDINISSYTNLTFLIGVAEDDSADGEEDWDDGTSFIVEIDIDNSGSFTKILQFEAVTLRPDGSSSTSNKEPALDTDFDGFGDGTPLSSSFQDFTSTIGSGSLIDIRLTFINLKNGDEDIAIDNIRIIDGYVATPTLFLVDGPASGSTIEVGPEDLAGDLEFGTTNFVVDAPSAGDGYISWSIINVTDGGTTHASGDIFDTSQIYPFAALDPFKTYTLTAELVDNSGASLSTPVVYSITANTLGYVVVSDIAALRAHVTANGVGSYYEITGASLVSNIDGFNNRHWVQDTNISGILIYDSQGRMSTYQVGDNVTGLKGQTEISNSLLRLVPSADSGVVASSGNSVTPQIVTIPDFNTNYETYESELIKLENVTFDAGDGVATFSTGSNYNVSSDAGTNIVVMRTDFFGADYIGQIIPSTQLPSLTAVAGRFNTTAQIYARSLADFTLDTKFNQIDGFAMYPNPTSLGYVHISSKNNANMSVAIFDILGKQVLNKTLSNNTLDVSGLTSGMYIMKVSQEDAISTKKLVIQ